MSDNVPIRARSFPKASCWVITGCLLTFTGIASSTQEQMAARARESLTRNSGYEMVSIQEFWGDAAYLTECTDENKPLPTPVTIYFEVLPDGKLGELLFAPETDVGRCIKAHVTGRHFTRPPGTYVTKIEMSFK